MSSRVPLELRPTLMCLLTDSRTTGIHRMCRFSQANRRRGVIQTFFKKKYFKNLLNDF
jgi:hypothetical protein